MSGLATTPRRLVHTLPQQASQLLRLCAARCFGIHDASSHCYRGQCRGHERLEPRKCVRLALHATFAPGEHVC
jgi:hypothetical protein